MGNIKVIICSHKEVELPKHPYFFPIQAGAALHDYIRTYQADNEGDNISSKNPHFCELTCHYWAWKNLKNVDIIGLNHYRRYFDFQNEWPQFSADKKFISSDYFLKQEYQFPDLEKLLQKYDIILPVARHWRVSNTQQYKNYHIAKDWEKLREIIKKRCPQYVHAFERTMDYSNVAVGYNMFITRWEYFEKYSEWLFDILFEVERCIPPIEDPVQSRIYGYMSERLINVFCSYHNLHITHIPLIMPLEDYHEGLNISNIHWCWRKMVNDFYFTTKGIF